MSKESMGKENRMIVFLWGFIRIQHVSFWFAVSFLGFLLGTSTLSLSFYIVPFAVFAVSIFCILSFTFAVNNYFDVDSDRINPRRKRINAIASGKISKKIGRLLIIILLIIPLTVCYLYKFEVFLFCISLLVWMFIYSAPPLRLKGRPGLDVIWHFFAFFLFVIGGSFISGSIGLISWLVAISFGVFSCIGQVWNHILDYSFDKDSGTKTFAVWVGLNNAKKTVRMLLLINIIILVPLILLYTLSYPGTIIVAIGGVIVGLYKSKPKPDFTKKIYFFFIYFTNAIYVSCFFYHIFSLYGIPTLNYLQFVN